jgi:hypothetical protein
MNRRQAVQGDNGGTDDRNPVGPADRGATSQESGRSSTPARPARPLQATLPVGTDGIADKAEDLPFPVVGTGGVR